MVHRVRAAIAAALGTALLLTGCVAGTTATSATAQLDFTVQTVDGRSFSGESLNGKPAVLWFWAPWCPVCQGEAPMVARVAAANPLVTFVGVGARDEQSALQDFVTRYGIGGFTELADTDSVVWTKFGITRQPAYAFLHPDGSVDVVKGSLDESELSARVAALG